MCVMQRPRSKRKSRDWYETQLTVAKEITHLEGYPEKNVPFTLLQMMDIGLRLILQAMETNSLVLLVMSLLWEDGSRASCGGRTGKSC